MSSDVSALVAERTPRRRINRAESIPLRLLLQRWDVLRREAKSLEQTIDQRLAVTLAPATRSADADVGKWP
jgi:hypothetical protein